MSRPNTFERVYAALRQRLLEGAFRPGDRLEPAALSEELNASVTPVRDALHRLTGERLVEAPRHEGFRVPMLTETMLRQLYAWHLDLLLLALARRTSRSLRQNIEESIPDKSPASVDPLFAALADRSGNPELVIAIRSVTDRLGSFQRIETLFLDAIDDEIGDIFTAIRTDDRRALRRSLVKYHRRRQRIVPELLTRLQSS